MCQDYGYCTHPAFKGKGVKLSKNDVGSWKRAFECKNLNGTKINELNCNPKCKWLNTDYGVGICLKKEYKGCCKLKKDESGNYIKICKDDVKTIAKKNKYCAKKVTVGNITYDSELEHQRHRELMLMEKAGIISDLQYHKKYILIEKNENGREIAYEADFVYNKDGNTIVEDTKSEPTKTRLYKLKKRLLLEKYGIKISEYVKRKECK